MKAFGFKPLNWNEISYNFLVTFRYLVAILFFKSLLYVKNIDAIKYQYKPIDVNLEVIDKNTNKQAIFYYKNWKYIRVLLLVMLLFACLYDSKSGILLAVVYLIQENSMKRNFTQIKKI